MSWRVVIPVTVFRDRGPEAFAALLAAGCQPVVLPQGPATAEEVAEHMVDADAAIAGSEPYTAEVFARATRLKVVSRFGVGYDAVDVAAATRAGIAACNTPGAVTEAVADYTLGMMIALARRIPEADAGMRAGEWRVLPGPLVLGKTLGLVGFGGIGRAVARRAVGFSMRVLAYDPAQTAEEVRAGGASPATLEEVLGSSDFVSVHAPLSDATRGLIGAAALAAMRPSAYLINTSRGGLIDDEALVSALRDGAIAGAALDVFTREPLPAESPLRAAPNCLLTPHSSYNAVECVARMAAMSTENVLVATRGERPTFLLNPEVWQSGQMLERWGRV